MIEPLWRPLKNTEKRQITSCLRFTVWKFQDFAITQILREINFEGSRSAKSAILTLLEALNFDFSEFLHILKGECYQINKIQSPKMAKSPVLELLHSSKLISRKI